MNDVKEIEKNSFESAMLLINRLAEENIKINLILQETDLSTTFLNNYLIL
jgi:hypothetical protein